ncbi:MAG: hypothetical protein WCL25_01650 [bacterium]
MKKYMIGVVFLIIGLFATAEPLLAQEIKTKRQVVSKEVVGTVSGISGNFVAVVYGRDPRSGILTEMAFNIGKDVTIKNKKSLKEINPEDTIKVFYDEITEISEDGRRSLKRVVKEVVFLRAADKKPEPQAEPEVPVGE